jgi:hypothetical protein
LLEKKKKVFFIKSFLLGDCFLFGFGTKLDTLYDRPLTNFFPI